MDSAWYITSKQRAGLANLAIAAAVALLAFLAWRIWREEPPQPALQRELHQVIVPWKCSNGHEFEAFGAYGPRPCEECGQPAHIVAGYVCKEHGVITAKLIHERGSDGQAVLTGISFADGEWIESPQTLTCPYCDKPLSPAPVDIVASRKDQGG